MIGADVSFAKAAEENGCVFKDGGKAEPVLEILRDHGYNWVRLRLFHTPRELPNNLEYTISLAQSAKKAGFHFLLDVHYSDTWADPAKQFAPRSWNGMTHLQLVEALFEYTRQTIAAFENAGVLPDMVQIGNEITNGMLWPDGRLPENWDNFADLVKAGIGGVEVGKGNAPRPRIMIHIDRGGDEARTKYFFDKLSSYHVPFDVIGQSYYPWWQGSPGDLRENMRFMAATYHKDIVLVEVAYCWRPTEYKTRTGPFPETPQGQKDFLEEVNRIVSDTPGHLGKGIFWWEPAVPVTGHSGGLVSRSFFDDKGSALPVISVFDQSRARGSR
jgi:arabinogalactan endo-1,4-beta-galactosidase